MGMFDSVIFVCDCGGRVEAQSKAGRCSLDEFAHNEVPPAIAADIDGDETYCDDCKKRFRVKAEMATTVFCRLLVAPSKDEDQEEYP